MENLAAKLSSNQFRNVVTLAGAGISTSAGISDFRSPKTGLFYNLKKYKVQYADVLLDKNYCLNNPEAIYSVIKDNFIHNSLKPTLTHCFIKLLDGKGILLRHYSQNIDGMELMTGLRPEKVIEAHGTLQRSYCIKCKAQYNYQWLCKKLEVDSVPHCDSCGGLVRPDIVLFGEELSQNFYFRSFIDLPECDLLIVLGTSLQVEPFASLVLDVPLDCPRLVINRTLLGHQPTNSGKNSHDSRSRTNERDSEEMENELIIAADCDTAILELVKLAGWEEDLQRVIREVKLRKLYGDVRSVEVGVQTLPLASEGESDFRSVEYPIHESRCSDFRCNSKIPEPSSTRVKSKPLVTPVKPLVNVEPQIKPKIRRSKAKLKKNPTAKTQDETGRRLCDRCEYIADGSPNNYR